MFTHRTAESFIQRAITAQSFAERHTRRGDQVMARIWRRYAESFSETATKIAMNSPAAEMAVWGGAL